MIDPLQGAIVLGFDDSPSSWAAATWAVREAASAKRRLRLVCAFRWPRPELHDLGLGQGGVVDEARTRRAAYARLASAVRHCRELAPGIDVCAELVTGNPVDGIGRLVSQADLLVVGASGQSGVDRVLLGSTAADLARRSRGSLLVVRPGGTPAPRNVVIGLDGSPASIAVAEFGFDFANRHDLPVTAVHAWSDLPLEALSPMAGSGPNIDRAPRVAEAALAGLLAHARENYPRVPVRHRVSVDRPTRTLLEQAPEAALLVVGRHGRAGGSDQPLGSVSHAVLHYARCPVAVVGPAVTSGRSRLPNSPHPGGR